MLYVVLRFLSFLILKSVFRLEVRGRENIPKKGSFVLAANHVSFLDPVVVGVSCPRRLSYMARHDLFCNRLASWFLSSLEIFPVKRDAVDLSAIKEALRRLRSGTPLLLFPEGRRRRADEGASYAKAQPGVGFLAAKLNLPIIPVLVKGTEGALPKGARFIRPEKISVYFGRQVYPREGLPYEDIAESIMEDIRYLGKNFNGGD